ncbi:MAG TPA: undecaprenyl-diphosphate phosphatase [Gemmatimonadales bacterium]|nr:undecaprenyl-diphosphate phosphatase [Gemmatimonadales bacterium]
MSLLAAPVHDLVAAALLGLVEGATEFIPVSSTGHLILAGEALGFVGARAKVFEIFIQLGAILAIVVIYWRKLVGLLGAARREPRATRLLVNLFVAFLPLALIGLVTHDWITEHLFRPVVVATALVVGGVLILVIERFHPRPSVTEVDDLPVGTAAGIGLAQALALIPGTSRSGATIMGGYAMGLSRAAATEFSFLLAVPVMVVATVYELLKSLSLLTAADVPVFAVGFVTAFLSALVVVRVFLTFVSRHSFAVFAWYRIVFGGVLLLWYFRTGG